jgi:hypothetical protein
MRKKTVRLTADEIAFMIALVARLNPNDYADDEIKAVIYRSKAINERAAEYNRLEII